MNVVLKVFKTIQMVIFTASNAIMIDAGIVLKNQYLMILIGKKLQMKLKKLVSNKGKIML
jgi:hypothetical protein